MKRQLTLFLVAIQFLTRLRVPGLHGFQPDWLAGSARYFPLVGVLIGLGSVGVWWLVGLVFPPTVAVGIMIAASLLLTGAFHEDGFADVCDGFGGGTTRDQVLAIMKDSRIGAYGAIGIGVVLGLKWTTCVAIPPAVFPLMLVGAHMFSRWCACALIWQLRYVRSSDAGKAGPLAGSLSGRDWLLSGALGAIAVAPFAMALDFMPTERVLLALAAAVAASAITTVLAARYFQRRIGGYTGDCLGAVQQLAELAFLLAALAVVGSAPRTG